MPIEDRTKHIIKCPNCKRSMGIKKKHKVNQRKYKFICLLCNTSFTLCLEEGFEVCKECKGSGILDLGSSQTFIMICNKCNGFSCLDWIERITGPPKYEAFTSQGTIFWIDRKRW